MSPSVELSYLRDTAMLLSDLVFNSVTQNLRVIETNLQSLPYQIEVMRHRVDVVESELESGGAPRPRAPNVLDVS